MPAHYAFITSWKIKAPIDKVWPLIYETESWPHWWRGVQRVKKIRAGNDLGVGAIHEYTWKSVLPYKLSFTMQVTDVERYKMMQGKSTGELQGSGIWHFQQVDGTTYLRYYWDVVTTKRWMNLLSFMLRPIFKYNHDVVMNWGAKGLAEKLGVEVVNE